MTTNDCVMKYLQCVRNSINEGLSIRSMRQFLDDIPFFEFSLAVYLNRKLDGPDDPLTLDQVMDELLDSHVKSGEDDNKVKITGYSPEESGGISSFYMESFFAYQHSMRYKGAEEIQAFFRRMFVYPYFYYHKYEADISETDGEARNADGGWRFFLNGFLSDKGAPWNQPDEPELKKRLEYDRQLRMVCSGYQQRYHLKISDAQSDWLDIIVEGFNTVLEEKLDEKRTLRG